MDDAAFEAYTAFNLFGKFCNRDVVTRADIDVRVAGIMPEKMKAGVREIVDIEEFAPGSAAAPHDNLASARHLCFMKATQQRRWHVAGLGVEVVAGPVKIRRHRRYEIASML